MKNRSVASVLLLGLFGVLSATKVKADTVAFTPPVTPTYADEPGDPVNLGLVFTADSSFSVDALGIYDLSDLTTSEQVGLYSFTGTLLASATVTLSDPEVSGYLFQSITPVTLTAGDTYTVVENTGNNDWAYYDASPPNTASEITYTASHYAYGGTLEDPTATDHIYYGPNFEIESAVTTPEPAGLGLAFPALVLLLSVGMMLKRRFTFEGHR
jgi:hypothetical protein